MASRSAALESFDEGTRLRALRGALDDARFVLTGVGALLVKESQRAFREQRLGNVRWKSREETGMNPNWPGILADFAQGKPNPPKWRFDGSSALTDKGMLRRSINFRVLSTDTVEAGTRLPYAAVLHSGGESKTVTITESIQRRLWEWIKKTGKAAVRAAGAGQRRKKREQNKAVKDDATLRRLKSRLGQLTAAWKGQRSPKPVVAQKKALRAQIKRRTEQVKHAAAGRSPAQTAQERDRAGSALKMAEDALRLKWLLNKGLRGKALPIRHPARPIVGLPKSLVAEIEELYGKTVGRVA